jgi:hypothetical protein
MAPDKTDAGANEGAGQSEEMSELTALELAVLTKLLDGDHPVLTQLRKQIPQLSVVSREFSGVGFFTDVSVLTRHDAVPESLTFGDVEATIEGLRNGAGFVLFVRAGAISMLEGYTYDEPWPETVGSFSLRYWEPTRAKLLADL